MANKGVEGELRFHLRIHHQEPIPLLILSDVISLMYESAEAVCRDWINEFLPGEHGDAVRAREALFDALERYRSELIWLEEVFSGSTNARGKFRPWVLGAIAALAAIAGHKYVEDVLGGLDIYNQSVAHTQQTVNKATHKLKTHMHEAYKKHSSDEYPSYSMEIKIVGLFEVHIDIYPRDVPRDIK